MRGEGGALAGGARRRAVVGAVAVAVLVLSACSSGSEPEEAAEEERERTTTTVDRSTTSLLEPTTTEARPSEGWIDERIPIFANDEVVVVREDDGAIVQLALDTGSPLQRTESPGTDFGGRIVEGDDGLLWVGSVLVEQPASGLSGAVAYHEARALDANDGSVRWTYPEASVDGDRTVVLGATSEDLVVVVTYHPGGGSTFATLDTSGAVVWEGDQQGGCCNSYEQAPLADRDDQRSLPSPNSAFLPSLPDSGREVGMIRATDGTVAVTVEPFDSCLSGYELAYGPGTHVVGCRYDNAAGLGAVEVVGTDSRWAGPPGSVFVYADPIRCRVIYLDRGGVVAGQGTVVAADADTGEVAWELPYTRELDFTLADQHYLYFGVTQVSLEDGTVKDVGPPDTDSFAMSVLPLQDWTIFTLPQTNNDAAFSMMVAVPGNRSGSILGVGALSGDDLTTVPPPVEPEGCA